jgi:hypothetical protein
MMDITLPKLTSVVLPKAPRYTILYVKAYRLESA